MHDNLQIDETTERQERRDARENRELLLSVAKQLFAEQGVAATSMKDIAQAAGVGKGTLYRNFAHKGELCGALLHEDVVAFMERVGALLDDTSLAPLPRLDILLSEKIKLTETHLPLLAAVEEAHTGGRPERPFRGGFGAWTRQRIVALLDEAVARGEAAPLDAAFTADAIIQTIAPPLYRYQRDDEGFSVERILAGVRQLFIENLRGRT